MCVLQFCLCKPYCLTLDVTLDHPFLRGFAQMAPIMPLNSTFVNLSLQMIMFFISGNLKNLSSIRQQCQVMQYSMKKGSYGSCSKKRIVVYTFFTSNRMIILLYLKIIIIPICFTYAHNSHCVFLWELLNSDKKTNRRNVKHFCYILKAIVQVQKVTFYHTPNKGATILLSSVFVYDYESYFKF